MKSPPDLTRVNGFAYKGNELVLSPKSPWLSANKLLADRYTIEAGQVLHHYAGSFYGWTGTHYVAIPPAYMTADIYHFLNYAKVQTITTVKEEGKADKEIRGFARFEPNRAKVGEVHAALQAAAHLSEAISSPAWLPEPVADLPADEIIACDNGLLHFPSRSLLPHTPEFFTFNAIGYNYRADAPPPVQWLAFLRQLWPNDQESIDTLQEIFGYCLVADTSQQKAFMLVGPKRSGKGTIARILEAVIGEHNVVSPTLASLGTNFGLSPLIGKRLGIISDARISGKTDTAIVAERLLAITGEDSVTADRKFLAPWTGKFDTRFLLISNELPRIADASGALPSRFVVLILVTSFYGKEDRGLTNRLMTERPGILNWAIEGYERLCARGFFLQPASASAAIQDLEDLGSPISAFIRDKCVIGSGESVQCAVLFDHWKTWCETQNRGNAGTLQTFGRDLRASVPGLDTTYPRQPGAPRVRQYEGIGLAPSDAPQADEYTRRYGD